MDDVDLDSYVILQYDETALILASEVGKPDAVKALLAAGANKEAKNKVGGDIQRDASMVVKSIANRHSHLSFRSRVFPSSVPARRGFREGVRWRPPSPTPC